MIEIYLIKIGKAWASSPFPTITHNPHLAASFRAIDLGEAHTRLRSFQDAGMDAQLVRFQLDNFNLTEAPWHQCPGCYKQVQENVGGEDELVCEACRDRQEHLDMIDELVTLRSREP